MPQLKKLIMCLCVFGGVSYLLGISQGKIWRGWGVQFFVFSGHLSCLVFLVPFLLSIPLSTSIILSYFLLTFPFCPTFSHLPFFLSPSIPLLFVLPDFYLYHHLCVLLILFFLVFICAAYWGRSTLPLHALKVRWNWVELPFGDSVLSRGEFSRSGVMHCCTL